MADWEMGAGILQEYEGFIGAPRDDERALVDMLASLMFLCKRWGLDFDLYFREAQSKCANGTGEVGDDDE